jgi:hypothetical protein
MKENVGSVDRVIRVIVGLALLSLVFLLDGGIRWVGLIGVIPLLTAVMSFCPLYAILGVNTRSPQKGT